MFDFFLVNSYELLCNPKISSRLAPLLDFEIARARGFSVAVVARQTVGFCASTSRAVCQMNSMLSRTALETRPR